MESIMVVVRDPKTCYLILTDLLLTRICSMRLNLP